MNVSLARLALMSVAARYGDEEDTVLSSFSIIMSSNEHLRASGSSLEDASLSGSTVPGSSGLLPWVS